MTKHRTSELTGALLDAAVAKAEDGLTTRILAAPRRFEHVCWLYDEVNGYAVKAWRPSTDWIDGGPIIERERITIEPHIVNDDDWVANREPDRWDPGWSAAECPWRGPTILIAAMRAYVASKLGEEVELP